MSSINPHQGNIEEKPTFGSNDMSLISPHERIFKKEPSFDADNMSPKSQHQGSIEEQHSFEANGMSSINPYQGNIKEEASFEDCDVRLNDIQVADYQFNKEYINQSENHNSGFYLSIEGETIEKKFSQEEEYTKNYPDISGNSVKESLDKLDCKNSNVGYSLTGGISVPYHLVESCNVSAKQHLNADFLKPCYVRLTRIDFRHQSIESTHTSLGDPNEFYYRALKCSKLKDEKHSETKTPKRLNVVQKVENEAKIYLRTNRCIVMEVKSKLNRYPKVGRNVVNNVEEAQSEAEKKFDEYMEWKYNLKCLICEEVFNDRSNYMLHILNEKHCVQLYGFVKDRIKYLHCPPCKFYCTRRRSRYFLEHLIKTKKHGEMGCVNVPKLTSKKMEDNSDTISQLDVDKKMHSDVQRDNLILGFNSNEGKLFRGGWHCKHCKMTISSWYKDHAISHIKRIHTKELTYKCKICHKILASDFNFKIHMQKHIENPSHLIHSTEKELICEYCGNAFKGTTSLRRHLNSKHISSEKYENLKEKSKQLVKCNECGKLIRQSNVRAHKKYHSEKNFCCEVCGKRFVMKCALQTHMDVHTKEKSKNLIQCNECGKLIRQSNVTLHKKSHSGKTFCCDVCGKQFVLKHHLQNHLVVHTPQRNYKCHICEFSFNLKHHLDSHLKTKHGIVVKKQSS